MNLAVRLGVLLATTVLVAPHGSLSRHPAAHSAAAPSPVTSGRAPRAGLLRPIASLAGSIASPPGPSLLTSRRRLWRSTTRAPCTPQATGGASRHIWRSADQQLVARRHRLALASALTTRDTRPFRDPRAPCHAAPGVWPGELPRLRDRIPRAPRAEGSRSHAPHPAGGQRHAEQVRLCSGSARHVAWPVPPRRSHNLWRPQREGVPVFQFQRPRCRVSSHVLSCAPLSLLAAQLDISMLALPEHLVVRPALARAQVILVKRGAGWRGHREQQSGARRIKI